MTAPTFKREERYYVLKISDMRKYLSREKFEYVGAIAEKLNAGRAVDGKTVLQAVVVEHDWPEYEQVWQMIQQRMTAQKMILIPEATVKLALEALQKSFPADGSKYEAELEQKHRYAITFFKESLAQKNGCCENPSQCWEPCGELGNSEEHVKVHIPEHSCPECVFGVCHCKPTAQQEPAAWLDPEGDDDCKVITASWKRKLQAMSTQLEQEHAAKHTVPAYTTPPQRKPLMPWVSASDRLPAEEDGEVLVKMRDGRCEIAWATYCHGASNNFAQWTFRDPDEDQAPTHWMLIPDAQGITKGNT